MSYLPEMRKSRPGSITRGGYKEYIFGMLFLKRLSNLSDQEWEQLAAELKEKRMPEPLIARKLANSDGYRVYLLRR